MSITLTLTLTLILTLTLALNLYPAAPLPQALNYYEVWTDRCEWEHYSSLRSEVLHIALSKRSQVTSPNLPSHLPWRHLYLGPCRRNQLFSAHKSALS